MNRSAKRRREEDPLDFAPGDREFDAELRWDAPSGETELKMVHQLVGWLQRSEVVVTDRISRRSTAFLQFKEPPPHRSLFREAGGGRHRGPRGGPSASGPKLAAE